MVAGVRAGRPSSGSGGLEAYAVPLLGLVLLFWLVRRLGPVLAQGISRWVVGEETPLEFSKGGKLKTKAKGGKSAAKGWSGAGGNQPRSPNHAKRATGSSQEREEPAVEEEELRPIKSAISPSYQELTPLAAFQDEEATATADALMESVEWTIQEGKRPRGTPKQSPKQPKPLSGPPPPPLPPRAVRIAFDDEVLRRIASGVQQLEARPNKAPWRPLSAGDVFVAHSSMREVTIEVDTATRYPTFGDAWAELGTQLLPTKRGVSSKQDADAAYASAYPASDVKADGVLVLRLQVIVVDILEDIAGAVAAGRGSSSDADALAGESYRESSAADGGGSSGAGGWSSSSSAPPCALPPSQTEQVKSNGDAGDGGGKGKAPYRRPGKAPAGGKAPRVSD